MPEPELRETVAQILLNWAKAVVNDDNPASPQDTADAILALPAVRGLLADRDTLARVAALAEAWTRYPQSPEERERNRYGAAMEDCGKALREIVGGAS